MQEEMDESISMWLDLKAVSDGLLITPQRKARAGWKEAIANALNSNATEQVDKAWLNAALTNDDDIK